MARVQCARPRGFRPRFSAPSSPSPVTYPAEPTGVQPLIARRLSPQSHPRVRRVRAGSWTARARPCST